MIHRPGRPPARRQLGLQAGPPTGPGHVQAPIRSGPGPADPVAHQAKSGSRSPGRWSCPCATGHCPAGQPPRSGRLELRLGPAWVRYRGSAAPQTDPPSTFHRPVLVPGRYRARSSRLRVTLPRYRPSLWRWPSAAMPTSPTCPARVRLPPDPRSYVVVPRRQGACLGNRPFALLGPAVLHRVAD
jgi:hypothetical protein